jgi:Tfp pilus assembly protein PilW
MRTTLAIDDDVLVAANGLAARQNKTVSEMVSALAGQELRRAQTKRKNERHGTSLLAQIAGASPVALELVSDLRAERSACHS